ncbi:cell wall-binding repeat-containing protein [Leucobacter sp. GX24907]
MSAARTWITGVTVAGLVATALVATVPVATPAIADEGSLDDVVLSEEPAEGISEKSTISEVELIPVEVPAGYTASAEVPGPTGDAQQKQLRDADHDDADGAARVDLDTEVAVIGVTWDVNAAAPTEITYRSLTDGAWSEWDQLEAAPVADSVPQSSGVEVDPTSSQATEPVFVTGSESVEVLALTNEGDPVEGLTLTVVDPRGEAPVENLLTPAPQESDAEVPVPTPGQPYGPDATEEPGEGSPDGEDPSVSDPVIPDDEAAERVESSEGAESDNVLADSDLTVRTSAYYQDEANVVAAASAAGLKIHPRSSWGGPAHTKANGKWVSPNTTYRGAVVHHTAGHNNYTREDVPAIIKGIYDYHVLPSVNFGDVGYQLLVDKFGGVWEGRYGSLSRQLVGAQAYGANYETFGISVLGNYETAALPKAAQDSTAQAIAWMFNKWGITSATGNIRVSGGDGRGRSVPVISGHRDIGSGTAWATACPGKYFYPKLPAIRSQVASYMYPPLSGQVKRYWDNDRFGTAAKVALASHPKGANTVYIANGMDFPDALAGGTAAGVDDAPVLLTLTKSLPAQTVSALKKLKPKNIIILGGTGSVNGTVATQLKSYGKVTRYGGADRYETAAKVARAKAPKATTVYIASGSDFPDALAGVPIAGKDAAPLLLTGKSSLPAATRAELQRIKPKNIVILGGTGVINTSVAKALGSYGKVVRRADSDRFGTAVKAAQAKYPSTVNTVYIANGMDFPDALSGGPAAWKGNSPLLLVTQNGVPAQTAAALKRMKPKKIVILGGTGAVSTANERRLDTYITK